MASPEDQPSSSSTQPETPSPQQNVRSTTPFSGLESALAGQPRRLLGGVKSPQQTTPVAIRSGGLKLVSFGTIKPSHLDVKSLTSRFAPNVNAKPTGGATQSGGSGQAAAALDGGGAPGGGVLDIGAVLAHNLQYKNQRSGTPSDIHLRRAALGARGMRNQNQAAAPAGVQAKIQRHLNTIRRKKGKKSKDVMELSWAEGIGGAPIYTPVTLPYVATMDEEEDPTTASTATEPSGARTTRSKRPTVHHIDESNRNAASLFAPTTDEDGVPDESLPQWYLVQFPEVLPSLVRPGQGETKRDADGMYCPSRLDGLPEGRLGTIEIRQSGRVVLCVGNHRFEINQGSDCNFAQEVACLVGGNAELMFLGRCQKRIVVTPDIAHYVGG